MTKWVIMVPASSANLGPGFDSAGLALNRYLTVHIEPNSQWEIHHLSALLPHAGKLQDHLIYQAANHTAKLYGKSLPSCKMSTESTIPLARGLGSSATGILAGVELANQLCNLALTTEQKLKHGVELEGHPDNIAPALLGGLIFSAVTFDDDIVYTRFEPDHLEFVVFIPEMELETKKARELIPEQFSKKYAARASAISNVLVGALASGEYQLAGKMMSEDLFHEPYRKDLIPNYQLIKQEAKKSGAYGTTISGAGPTMIAFVPEGKGRDVKTHMQNVLPDYEISSLTMDVKGLQVSVG